MLAAGGDAGLGPVAGPLTPFPDEDLAPPVENRGLVYPEIEVYNDFYSLTPRFDRTHHLQ